MEEALHQCIADIQQSVQYTPTLRLAGVMPQHEFRHTQLTMSPIRISMLQAHAISWFAKCPMSDDEFEQLAEMILMGAYAKYLVEETRELDAYDLSTLFGDSVE